MSKTNLTAGEVFDSLTGHDEDAVTQHFGGRTIGELTGDASMWGRALIFVLLRRGPDAVSDDSARIAVMDMPLKAVTDYFAEESEESGKDEPADEPTPATSLISVS